MKVRLKYGFEGLEVDLPETPNFKGIITPDEPSPITNVTDRLNEMINNPIDSKPLIEIAKNRKNAVIVISDITRPVPNKVILPPILSTIERAGIKKENISILIATGIHRPNEGEELTMLVGEDIANNYRIINHLSKNDNDMELVGYISNGKVPVYINKYYLKADLKILTGFIEPHLWAGFSGGRKSILPGVSSIKTLEYMHSPEMVAHPKTVYGVLEGNPFHEAGLQVMEKSGADFILNVTLNTKKEITGIFAGNPVTAHIEGCNFLSKFCIKYIDEPLDFVVTTNSGAPLDINLYQTVKGMSVVAPVLKEGATILIASKCFEGLGSPEYVKVLNMIDSPDKFLKRLMNNEFFIPDQWCAQETYQIILKHPTWIYSDLPDDILKKYFFHPVSSIEAAVKKLLSMYGNNASWAVLPDGPMVIVKLK